MEIGQSDPLLVRLVIVIVSALAFGWILDRMKQPAVIGYIIAGVVLGPQLLGFIQDRQIFHLLGQFGLMFLLFYIGSEVDIKRLMAGWKVSILGCLLQVLANVFCCLVIGWFLGWSLKLVVFIGFVTSLSSTAVVMKILEDARALNSVIGRHCLGILLVQDFMVIFMLIILGLLGEGAGSGSALALQSVGVVLIAAVVTLVVKNKKISIPMWLVGQNQDFKVLAGLLFCLGSALVTGVLGLSAELGAFVAGLALGCTEEGENIKDYIHPFKVFFLCLFFVSVGLLFDLRFLSANIGTVFSLVLLVLVMNSVINAAILVLLGLDRLTAFLTGTLLSQIGEFSYLLAAAAISSKVIGNYGYQVTISVIALTLMFTPLWLHLNRRMLKYSFGSGGTGKFQSLTRKTASVD